MLNAISLSSTSFRIPTELQEGLQLDSGHALRAPGPYNKRSADLQFYANGLKAYRVPDQLTTREAAGIFAAWINEEALHTRTFRSHWTSPGHRKCRVFFIYMLSADNYLHRALRPFVLCQARRGRRKSQRVCVEGGYGYFGYLVKYLLVINARSGCSISVEPRASRT